MLWCVRPIVLGLLLVSSFPDATRGEVLLAYESLNPEGGVPASQFAAAITPLELTRSAAIGRASGSTFNTRGWNTEPEVLGDAYIEWGWRNSSRAIDLQSLDIRYDRSSSGPKQLEIHLAVNDSLFEPVFCDAEVLEAGETNLGIDLSEFTDVESAVFRLYAYDADRTSGTFDLEAIAGTPNQAVIVNGEVSAVPEPGVPMLALSLVPCLGASLVKRSRSRRKERREL